MLMLLIVAVPPRSLHFKTLVLFWNPGGCGFCQQMLPDLKEWGANPPEGAPNLLVGSAGTAEANKEMGLNGL